MVLVYTRRNRRFVTFHVRLILDLHPLRISIQYDAWKIRIRFCRRRLIQVKRNLPKSATGFRPTTADYAYTITDDKRRGKSQT